jgi:glycosyltransferase involved in cell wall biosynthesis
MLVHLFPTFSNDASRSPLALELAALGVQFRLFPQLISLRYQSRLALMFLGWPKIFIFAIKSAYKSLFVSEQKPDVVILGSDIEVFVFGMLRAALLNRKTKIVLLGFIYTPRSNSLLSYLRRQYFRRVFSFADVAICHSSLEAKNYANIFINCKARFEYIPYGMHVAGRESVGSSPIKPPYILSAGRSGRDYKSLVEAVRGQDLQLHIVCDSTQALLGLDLPDNVTVLRNCYGGDYIREIAGSSLIVIPLAVGDISAGQMVMLQAMAFSKPIVMTDTPSIREYVQHQVNALLVNPADPQALRQSIAEVIANPELAEQLGSNGFNTFEENFSMRAYVRNMMRVIHANFA